VRSADGRALPPELLARLRAEGALLDVLDIRLAHLEGARHQQVRTARVDDGPLQRVRQFLRLRSIREASAWMLTMEFFWRAFRNRRQVASAAGLTPAPFASGETCREQGISKAGNARIRQLMVELAWSWLRWQPDSALTRWFHVRFAANPRSRRIGIVAGARRLLIQLWRYAEYGEIPPGAVLKTAPVARRRGAAVERVPVS
jgi:transposase